MEDSPPGYTSPLRAGTGKLIIAVIWRRAAWIKFSITAPDPAHRLWAGRGRTSPTQSPQQPKRQREKPALVSST